MIIGYQKDSNQFQYLYQQQAYSIEPKPEACSYLETNQNIRASGIVIGSNIETLSFLLPFKFHDEETRRLGYWYMYIICN